MLVLFNCLVLTKHLEFSKLFFQAIFLLHANRIGHGYHVLGDEDLYKYVIEKQIHLEVSTAAFHAIFNFLKG